ncbi:MAG: serine/threonine protein kinase [Polyangiaceae bacterium]|nr:serine/threonine protein kinase [Polyangiaceae bacterium]
MVSVGLPHGHGAYRMHEVIAEGGMAVVHRGEFLGAHGYRRAVALKRLKPHLAGDAELVAMLLDEARLSGHLRSPHWARVLDTIAVGREIVLVTDWVPGVPLSALLGAARRAGEPVAPGVAAAIGSSILAALADAHRATDERGRPLGIVHRDISPQNVLLTSDGFVRVIDLGVAMAAWRRQCTRAGEIKGKPAWMAPEQLLGERVDARADLFAVGVILWEALQGRRLHDADAVATVLERLRTAPPRLAAPVPTALAEVVERALAWEPSERFQDAASMALAVEAAVPLAPASEVGAWVRRHGGILLADRERPNDSRGVLLAEGAEPAGSHFTDLGTDAVVETTIGVPATRRGGASARAARRAALALALAAGTASGFAIATLRGAAPRAAEWREASPRPPLAGAIPALSHRIATQAASGEPPVAPVAPPGGDEPRSRSRGAPAGRPPAASASRGAGDVAAGNQRRPAPTAARSCPPPWETDADGVRTWKEECL